MPMNVIIQKRRKENGLTQVQVAKYLGVSTPAVNKWEKGITNPDINIRPALARLLGTDLNTLLCFHEDLSEKEIGNFMNEVVEEIRTIGFEYGVKVATKKVQEYPNCAKLIHSTALVLEGALLMYGEKVENKEVYEERITKLYERLLKSDDEEVRNEAIFMLASKYLGHLEYKKTQDMLDLLPERSRIDKKKIQANLLVSQKKFADAASILEGKLLREVNEIQGLLASLADIAIREKRETDASYLAELSGKVARQFHLWEYSVFSTQFQIAVAREDMQESLSFLKSMLLGAFSPWDITESPLYCHCKKKGNGESFGIQMIPAILLELKNDPKYLFLHSNSDFQELIKEYDKKSRAKEN